MSLTWIVVAVLVALAVAAAVLMNVRRSLPQRDAVKSDLSERTDVNGSLASAEDTRPQRIVVGASPDRPLMSVQLVEQVPASANASPSSSLAAPTVERISTVLQAVPGLLLAGEADGRRLMEVVINGELTPATDGVGWRAFATGPKGIAENARLLDADKLQNMINCAAVWQLASVIVAQKHLADISRKLDEIAKGVSGISNFLDDERRSKVEGAYSWLRQATDAVTAGEMTAAVRHQLEGVERDLESILNHLIREFRRELSMRVKEDSIGTEDQTDGLVRKAKHLEGLGADMEQCLRSRVAAWHVLTLFPGEPVLKKVRREAIERDVGIVKQLADELASNISAEAAAMSSFWNWQSTIDDRRKRVHVHIDSGKSRLTNAAIASDDALVRTTRLLGRDAGLHRLYLEIERGRICAVRHAMTDGEPVPAGA